MREQNGPLSPTVLHRYTEAVTRLLLEHRALVQRHRGAGVAIQALLDNAVRSGIDRQTLVKIMALYDESDDFTLPGIPVPGQGSGPGRPLPAHVVSSHTKMLTKAYVDRERDLINLDLKTHQVCAAVENAVMAGVGTRLLYDIVEAAASWNDECPGEFTVGPRDMVVLEAEYQAREAFRRSQIKAVQQA